jgi:hypothetical protein
VNKTVGEHIRDLEGRRQRLNEESLEDGLSQQRSNELMPRLEPLHPRSRISSPPLRQNIKSRWNNVPASLD